MTVAVEFAFEVTIFCADIVARSYLNVAREFELVALAVVSTRISHKLIKTCGAGYLVVTRRGVVGYVVERIVAVKLEVGVAVNRQGYVVALLVKIIAVTQISRSVRHAVISFGYVERDCRAGLVVVGAVKRAAVTRRSVLRYFYAVVHVQLVKTCRAGVVGSFRTIFIAADCAAVVANDRADITTAADCDIGETFLNRAIDVFADNAADRIKAAEFAADRAVINRAIVVIARDAADKVIAADIDINQRDVFNRAAVVAEQAYSIIFTRYLEVTDTVALPVERALEHFTVAFADGRPVRYSAQIYVGCLSELQTVAFVPAVDVIAEGLQVFNTAYQIVAVFERQAVNFRSVGKRNLRGAAENKIIRAVIVSG